MDLQVLSEKSEKSSLIDDVERLLTNRRVLWQARAAHPPHLLGWTILALAAIETGLTRAFFQGMGWGPAVLQTIGKTFFLFLIPEIVLVSLTSQAGLLFNKKGSAGTLFAFFNTSWTPFLLYLPLNLLFIKVEQPIIQSLIVFVLFVKVLSNWREAMEIVYKFSKAQSAIAVYVAAGVICSGALAFFYLNLIGRAAAMIG